MLYHMPHHMNLTCSLPSIGNTPLLVAAVYGHLEVLKRLVIIAEADVDIQDTKLGNTALHYSVKSRDLPMARYLIKEVWLGR